MARLGRWVWQVVKPVQPGFAVAAAVLAVMIFLLLWGLLMAPKATWRLASLPRALIAATATLLLAYGFYRQGDFGWSLLLIPVAVIQILGQLTGTDVS